MSTNLPRSISNEARGRVRALMAALEVDAAKMERAAARIPAQVLNGISWKGPIGSARAIQKIVAAMPRPPDLRGPRMVAWRFLSPVGALPTGEGAEAEPPRPGVVMKALVAAHRKPGRRVEPFGFAATLHALHRLCDRSGFAVDPAAAMYAAHDALMSLQTDEGPEVFALSGFPLPTMGGFFLCRPHSVGAGDSPLATGYTWVANDQAHSDQARDVGAWQRLMDQVAA
jgi:hypothetical protein